MNAQVEKNGEILIIHLNGKIDFEAAEFFQQACQRNWKGQKLVFNLEGLNFVGSQGITPFLESVLGLGRDALGAVKICGLRTEFRRLFDASQHGEIEIFEDMQRAVSSFSMANDKTSIAIL